MAALICGRYRVRDAGLLLISATQRSKMPAAAGIAATAVEEAAVMTGVAANARVIAGPPRNIVAQ